jgi:hypothetical protein
VRVTPPYDAVMVAEVALLTAAVEMPTTVDELPADTVAVDGTDATAELLLDSDTVAPPDGAAPESTNAA